MSDGTLGVATRSAAPKLLTASHHPVLGPLQSRVVMSAMTRSSAGPGHVATPAMAEYYARRARHGVGLVLTESIAVDPAGVGFPDEPRLCTPEQASSWRAVTDATHDSGAPIFAQLLHCGRITHEDYTDGLQPISSTGRRAEGINRRNAKPYGVPRRLEPDEFAAVYDQHLRAAALAIDAGFDGVEIHLAHGYLADQFLDARVNDRTDDYGGSVENRCRFALELTEHVVGELGADRVMVRISPSRWMNGLYEWPDMDAMIHHLVAGFDGIGLRLLDVSCANADYRQTAGPAVRTVRAVWPHTLIGGASLPPEEAQAELDAGALDLVTYGRFLIANPDLVERWRDGLPLTDFDGSMLESLE